MRKLYQLTHLILIMLISAACKNDDSATPDPQGDSLYFPPINSQDWETTSPEGLGWSTTAVDNLLTYLETNNTRAFIILVEGRIVVEAYFGNNILGTTTFDVNSQWYWASAGKTLTATLVGIAQQEGRLSIDNPTSNYLGTGWTSLPADKEALITVRNQLTMTSGLDYGVADLNCTDPSCLVYKTDAGDQWYYHNAAYTLLERVVEDATGIDYNDYTNQKVEAITGMSGQWLSSGYNNIYWSTARDMARFGLLMLNRGSWGSTGVLKDQGYYHSMVGPSQDLNPSYGYLWWLNGENSIIYPGLPNTFNTSLSPNAPTDLFAGMGFNGQFVEVIPSKNMVVVRMGEAPEGSAVPIAFHDEMWSKINSVIN